MKSTILIGDEKQRNLYVDKYIKDNKIKSYNIIKFENRIKIADIREIKRIVSIKQSEPRIFLLSSDITTEAQNALLKTIEELPLLTDFVFMGDSKEDFLPTILSRSFIINLKKSTESENSEEYEKDIFQIVENLHNRKKSIYLSFLLVDKLTLKKEEDRLKKFMVCLRNIILKELKKEENLDKDKIEYLYKLLENLNHYYPLVVSNNLNKKIVMDNLLLGNILEIF